MPRADDPSLFDHALPQRASLVKAGVLHGVDLAAHVGDADQFVAAGEFFDFVNSGKVGLGSKSREDGESVFSRQPSAVS